MTIEDCRLEVGPRRATGNLKVVFELFGQGTRSAMPLNLKLTFARERRGWHRVWLVTSVDGYREGNMIEGISDSQ